MTEPKRSEGGRPNLESGRAYSGALHIRLVCWDHQHEQAISPEQLRQIVIAPICTFLVDKDICGSAIWAVKHEGEPTRYVGRPPQRGWESWADCIKALTDEPRSDG